MFTRFTESVVSKRKFASLLLALFSLCGTSIGAISAYQADHYFLSLMRVAVSQPVSIVDLLILILLPFLITAAVSFVGQPYLFLPISFFKSLSFSLVFVTTCVVYSFAGWLVSGLLLLTNAVVNFLLHLYWIRNINEFHKSARLDLLFALLISLLIGAIDFLIVSPYLAALMNS